MEGILGQNKVFSFVFFFKGESYYNELELIVLTLNLKLRTI